MPSIDSRWVGWAQWLALLTMSPDHLVRHLLGPESALAWWPESLGRLAFPLFAAMVAWHDYHTSRDPLRYARRILLIGGLAQLPYALMPRPEAPYVLNVCFTLAAGLAWAHWAKGALAQWAHGESSALARSLLPWAGLVLSLGAWWALGFWVEFGHAGLALVPALMLALSQQAAPPEQRWIAGLPALAIAALLNPGIQASAFALAGVLLAWAMAGAGLPRVPWPLPRWLWRAWYPGHFALLALGLAVLGELSVAWLPFQGQR
ncbi:TraX family protein [Halomonas sp. 328]|uniref:TraX family protein n=1 Tax=Halomonas sp. 328 TaxID=2776704 RepID=UPI0018A77E90|nr:TraX family protein [Halomonas sp. 328]MBF8222028.1 TraX [Halomonas sp. 328]